jgi:chaperone BCS1
METLINQLWTMLQEQLANNQFLSGGAVLMVLGATAALCRDIPRRCWDWIVQRAFMEFEIPMRDDAFLWFSDWLAEQPYSKNRARWLSVRTARKRKDGPSSQDDETKPTIILSPAPGSHWLWWKGYFMVVTRERKEPEAGGGGLGGGQKSMVEREVYNVSVLTWRRDLIVQLLEEARKVSEPPNDERVKVYVPHYGDWDNVMKKNPRPMGSVILPEGVLEGLLGDMQTFLGREKWYSERGIPYRRGYKFEGPPGNGKSSLVLALASSLKLDVCILNLNSAGTGDDELRRLFADVPDKAIVLIEDVDCAYNEREATDDKDSKITFSGLLNAIDGVVAAEGRILIMTTNHPEKLDAALTRPGRCDVTLKIDNADLDQACRLFLRFFPGNDKQATQFGAAVGDGRYSMASLQGHLLKYATNSDEAITTIAELLNEPKAADEGSDRTTGQHGVQASECVGTDA